MEYSKEELHEQRNSICIKIEEITDAKKRIISLSAELEEDYSRNVAYLEKILLEGKYGAKTIDLLEEVLGNTKKRRKSNEERTNECIAQLDKQYQESEERIAELDYEIENVE